MIYIAWYIGIGAVLVGLLLLHGLLIKDASEHAGAGESPMSRSAKPKPNRLHKIAHNSALTLSAIPAWPLLPSVVIYGLYEHWTKRNTVEEPPPPPFAVTSIDLGALMTREEIEAAEMVFDPLGAVPNLAFGHLNTAWLRFLEAHQENDQFRAFSTSWNNQGWMEDRRGYVLMRNDQPREYFLTVRKMIK